MKSHLNLLPLDYRIKALARRRILQWFLVWLSCAVAAAGLWGLKQSRCRASRQAMQAAERSYAPLEKLTGQSEAMRSELQQLRARGTTLGGLLDERPALTLIGLVSRSARQCEGRLVVQKLLFERSEQPANADASKANTDQDGQPEPATQNTEPWGLVTLEGEALDNVAVATFVVSLRDSGLFRRVELKSSVGKKSAHEQLRSYLLECDI